jgi:hypothetical protein
MNKCLSQSVGEEDGPLLLPLWGSDEGADIFVLALCPLEQNPRPVLLVEGEEAAVQLQAFFLQNAYHHIAACML